MVNELHLEIGAKCYAQKNAVQEQFFSHYLPVGILFDKSSKKFVTKLHKKGKIP